MKDLLELGLDGAAPGWRIARVEILNFGGYHAIPAVFDFGRESAIFSGENGAGKSTALDGAQILFSDRPKFNAATDSAGGKGVRSLESYLLGAYSTEATAAGRKRTLYLRGYERTHMAVLMEVRSEGGRVFTMARMLRKKREGAPNEWRSVTAAEPLRIEGLLDEWRGQAELKRHLAEHAPSVQVHGSFDDYLGAVARTFGFETLETARAAFDLLVKTIGAKSLTSTTIFARDHILPATRFEEVAQTAIARIDGLNAQAATVRRIEEQVVRLEEIDGLFARLDADEAAHARAIEAGSMKSVFDMALSRSRARALARRASAGLAQIRPELAAKQEEGRVEGEELASVVSRLGETNVARVPDMKARLRLLEDEAARREAELVRRGEAAARAGIRFAAEDAEGWARTGRNVLAARAAAGDRIAQLKAGHQAKIEEKAAPKARRAGLAEELKSARENRSNIDSALVRRRAEFAEALGLAPEDAPFLAEIVRVRDEDDDWEGAANRVLGGLGVSILVAEHRYEEAKLVANRRNWGVRLRVRALRDAQVREIMARRQDGRALSAKIEARRDHPLGEIAEALVREAAPHLCLDEAAFSRERGRACTREGAVQGGDGRLEKDDRHDVVDRLRWVLGWSQEARIAALEAEIGALDERIRRVSREADEFEAGLDRKREVLTACEGLAPKDAWPRWSAVSSSEQRREAGLLSAEIHAIEHDPDVRQLVVRRDELETRARTRGESIRGLTTKAADAERRVEAWRTLAEDTVKRWRRMREDFRTRFGGFLPAHRALWRRALAEDLPKGLAERPLRSTVLHEGADASILDRANPRLTTFQERARKRASETRNSLKRKVEDFRQTYSEVATDLSERVWEDAPGAVALRAEWLVLLERHRTDDLPRNRKLLEEMREQGVAEALQTLNMTQQDYRREVDKVIDGINRVIETTPYDAGAAVPTYARLIHRPSDDERIVNFQRALQRAVDKSARYDAEVIAEEARAAVDMIRMTDDARGEDAEHILDLRNWFRVDVEEYEPARIVTRPGPDGHAAPETLPRRAVRYMDGSDGTSGGQQERLTMLMLGAAISYAFGARDGMRPELGLQAILLDEAYMRSSERTAVASTDILRALGLQIIAATPAQKLSAYRKTARKVFTVTNTHGQAHVQPMLYDEILTEPDPEPVDLSKTSHERAEALLAAAAAEEALG